MNAVVTEPRRRAASSNPMQMLAIAVERGDDIEKLRQLMDLKDRWEAAENKRAYVTAFAAFKKNMPDVVNDMLNKQYDSDYSSLANLVNTVNRALGEYGLHATWKPDTTTPPVISVMCIVTHVEGHSEAVAISGPPDTSGTKNPLQAIKSTLTYLEGATFQAITGVVARSASKDDDGNGFGKKEVQAPEGFDNWHADMSALADEGIEKLQAAWKASKDEYRRYVVKYEEIWWTGCKRKAAKVKTP